MELGSEYHLPLSELTVTEKNIFSYLSEYPCALYFNSGRSALRHLASCFHPGDEVLMPEFICESVTACLRSEDIRFYRLHADFTVNTENLRKKITAKTRFIFLMHYFGGVQPPEILDEIRTLAREHGCLIIEDTTHSIFSNSRTVGDYQLCSLRKWMPIPNGGVLYAREDPLGVFQSNARGIDTDNERSYGMVLKDLFLRGELDCNAEYRGIFSTCEKRLDKQKEILLLSDFARFIASCFDIDALKNARRRNYARLKAALGQMGIAPAATLENDSCPLVLPVRVPRRDRFRAYLMDNRIYCAVHWPFDGVQPEHRPFARTCAENLLSLPIDQRYGEEAISYLIDVIQNYGGDLLF